MASTSPSIEPPPPPSGSKAFSSPSKKIPALSSYSLLSPRPTPATTDRHCLCRLTSSGHFIQMGSSLCDLACPASFTWHRVFKVRPCCGRCQCLIPFHGRVINIPLHEQTPSVYSSSAERLWGCFHLWAVVNMLL